MIKIVENAAPVSIVTASILLAAGFLQAGEMAGVWIMIGIGGSWVFAQQMGWSWVNSLGFLLYYSMATLGAFLEISALWLIVGAGFALAGWDSALYLIRIENFIDNPRHEILSQRYFYRLIVVISVGMGMGALAALIQLQISFGIAFLLGLIIFLGLGQTIRYLRRESD